MTIYSWEHSQRVHLISMGESTLTKSANAHVDICEAGKRVYFTHDRGENRLFYVKVRRRKKNQLMSVSVDPKPREPRSVSSMHSHSSSAGYLIFSHIN